MPRTGSAGPGRDSVPHEAPLPPPLPAHDPEQEERQCVPSPTPQAVAPDCISVCFQGGAAEDDMFAYDAVQTTTRRRLLMTLRMRSKMTIT